MHAPEASTSNVAKPSGNASEAAIFKRLHPTTYLSRFTARNVRPDGRAFDEARDVSINAGERKRFLYPSNALLKCSQAQ